jgi:thioredoxin-like negative regulator of GroEL
VEHDVRLRRENPLLQNLLPDFAQALNTLSEVGGVLVQIANDLLRTSDAEDYRQILTQATNHLPLPAHRAPDMRYIINSRQDVWNNINASRYRWRESEMRQREEYD